MGLLGDTWNGIKNFGKDTGNSLYEGTKETGKWIAGGSPESALVSPIGFGVWGYNAISDATSDPESQVGKGPNVNSDKVKKYYEGLRNNGVPEADARKMSTNYAIELDPANGKAMAEQTLGLGGNAPKLDTTNMTPLEKKFAAASGTVIQPYSQGYDPATGQYYEYDDSKSSKFDAQNDWKLSNDTIMEKTRNDQLKILGKQREQFDKYTSGKADTLTDIANKQAQGQRSAENIRQFAGDAPNASMAFQNSLQGQNKFGDYLKMTNDKAAELNSLQKGINTGYSAVQASDASRGISFDQQQQTKAQLEYAKQQAEAADAANKNNAFMSALSQVPVVGPVVGAGVALVGPKADAPKYKDPGTPASSTPSDKNNKQDISEQLFSKAKPYQFSYKNKLIEKIAKGKTNHDKQVIKDDYSKPRIGIMAQDLEKSKPGKEIVTDDPELGKVLDNQKSISALFASLSAQQQQLTEQKRQMNQINNSLIRLSKHK